MTQDMNEKIQLERIEDMLIQDILETSDEEIMAELADEYEQPEKEIEGMKAIAREAVLKFNKAKFEAAKRARLEQKQENRTELKIDSLERKKEIIKALNSNDNFAHKITMAARNEDELSEADLDVYLRHLVELRAIDEEGNLLCEDD